MVIASKMDEFGRAGWVGATVLGFWLFWPVGVAVLLFLCWTGRLRAWRYGYAYQNGANGQNGPGRWYNEAQQGQGNSGPGNSGPGSWGPGSWGCGWGKWNRGGNNAAPASGNRAFDEYRAETLRRLEDEQREFVEYLERLRQAKDKAEFDQFMADRRRPPVPTEQPPI